MRRNAFAASLVIARYGVSPMFLANKPVKQDILDIASAVNYRKNIDVHATDPIYHPPGRHNEFPIGVNAKRGKFRHHAASFGHLDQCGATRLNLIEHAKSDPWIVNGNELHDGLQVALRYGGELHPVRPR
jgi:hypothetical protein